MLCHTSHSLHCTKTVPLSQASGLIALVVVPPANPMQRMRSGLNRRRAGHSIMEARFLLTTFVAGECQQPGPPRHTQLNTCCCCLLLHAACVIATWIATAEHCMCEVHIARIRMTQQLRSQSAPEVLASEASGSGVLLGLHPGMSISSCLSACARLLKQGWCLVSSSCHLCVAL